jgi:hypothetical protein
METSINTKNDNQYSNCSEPLTSPLTTDFSTQKKILHDHLILKGSYMIFLRNTWIYDQRM